MIKREEGKKYRIKETFITLNGRMQAKRIKEGEVVILRNNSHWLKWKEFLSELFTENLKVDPIDLSTFTIEKENVHIGETVYIPKELFASKLEEM